VAGRANVDIFMLHPKGRVSDVQRRQMTTVLAPNVHNIAVDGTFDDAQAMVKRMFNDDAMTGAVRDRRGQFDQLGAADGAGGLLLRRRAATGRAAAQRCLCGADRQFRRCLRRLCRGADGPADRARLIVATNVNDILHRALTSGDYSAGTVTPTAAPSMDIQVSSNFRTAAVRSGRARWRGLGRADGGL
jgi:threonine synthase